jgi:hypothetical protein
VRTNLENMVSGLRPGWIRFVIYFVPGSIAVSKSSDIAYYPWNEDLSDSQSMTLKDRYDPERDSTGTLVCGNRPHFYLRNGPNQPVFPGVLHFGIGKDTGCRRNNCGHTFKSNNCSSLETGAASRRAGMVTLKQPGPKRRRSVFKQ